MVLHYIWIGFFLIACIVGLVQLVFFQDVHIFERMMSSSFDMAKLAVMDIALPLAGIMTLWLGILHIGEKAGAIRVLSKWTRSFFATLFPEIPDGHPAQGELLMNFSANMLGLDNAATPMGLKAMQSLQEINPHKETASNAQIMFLALNTSGLTIIPVSILAQRAILGAANPTDIFLPILIATYVSTITAILFVGLKQRLNLFKPGFLTWMLGLSLGLGLLVYWFSGLDKDQMHVASSLISNLSLFAIIIAFLGGAAYKRINVWDAFIEGAKTGFETSVKIIPYMVGMLVGIGVFRASGAMELLTDVIRWIMEAFNIQTQFVDALPTAFMKPLSGSGAKSMMVESMINYGPDSFTGRLSCMFQGAADTTFYIIALYFGSVGIRKTRYAVTAGLVADLAGVITAIILAYIFFNPTV
ncbi:MAG: nucleoside recognition domain-containing protein [Bacteroidales bacterium]|nr:nucleoside recognition domain-containing protein [Bacteroidales bacterium]